MTGHDGRRRPDHDWRAVGECQVCRGKIVEMRRGGSYARQTEHKEWCRATRPPQEKKK